MMVIDDPKCNKTREEIIAFLDKILNKRPDTKKKALVAEVVKAARMYAAWSYRIYSEPSITDTEEEGELRRRDLIRALQALDDYMENSGFDECQDYGRDER